jgi:hypothetical protein
MVDFSQASVYTVAGSAKCVGTKQKITAGSGIFQKILHENDDSFKIKDESVEMF